LGKTKKTLFLIAVMRNTFLLLAAFLFIGMTTSSCKKDWTCECSDEDRTDSVSYSFEALRKNDARSLCLEYQTVWGGTCKVKEIK